MSEIKIIKSEVANGEFLIEIKENNNVTEYTLQEADEKFGSEFINKKYNEYLNNK